MLTLRQSHLVVDMGDGQTEVLSVKISSVEDKLFGGRELWSFFQSFIKLLIDEPLFTTRVIVAWYLFMTKLYEIFITVWMKASLSTNRSLRFKLVLSTVASKINIKAVTLFDFQRNTVDTDVTSVEDYTVNLLQDFTWYGALGELDN